jgi:hypothetical protein
MLGMNEGVHKYYPPRVFFFFFLNKRKDVRSLFIVASWTRVLSAVDEINSSTGEFQGRSQCMDLICNCQAM